MLARPSQQLDGGGGGLEQATEGLGSPMSAPAKYSRVSERVAATASTRSLRCVWRPLELLWPGRRGPLIPAGALNASPPPACRLTPRFPAPEASRTLLRSRFELATYSLWLAWAKTPTALRSAGRFCSAPR